MVKTTFRRFRHVEGIPMDFVVRRVDQMKGSQITRRGVKPLKVRVGL